MSKHKHPKKVPEPNQEKPLQKKSEKKSIEPYGKHTGEKPAKHLEKKGERFFISCPLGFERLLVKEIIDVWPWLLGKNGRTHSFPCPVGADGVFEKGGVEVDLPFELGIQLNYYLKTAHRILWRIDQFKCRDFAKLFRKFADLDFKSITGTEFGGSEIGVEIAASESRLNHEGRIREIFEQAQKLKPSKPNAPKSEASQDKQLKVYIRNFDDFFSVSLDTSGHHLHFRVSNDAGAEASGPMVGTAPLRETLAAGLLQVLIGDTPWSQLKEIGLVDPMAGSGTFLIEAANLAVASRRNFAFQGWKRTPVLFRTQLAAGSAAGSLKWKALEGYDIDPQILKIAQHKKALNGVASIQLKTADLFSGGFNRMSEGRRWLISNPPYGERLAANFSVGAMLLAAFERFRPERMGVVLSKLQQGKAPEGIGNLKLNPAKSLAFSNGGIPVVFQVWESA